MKVSIITCTYNSEKSIMDCVNSVMNQTYLNVEHLIIDGVSKDNTLRLVEESGFEGRIISEVDNGIYDAFNKGVLHATGDIVGFVHSDDLLSSTVVLEKIVEEFKAKEPDGVYGDLLYVSQEDTTKVIRYWKSKDFRRKLLSKGWMPAHPTLFLKKEVYKKHGNFNLELKVSADYEFMLRILKDEQLKFSYLPEVTTRMRVGGNSNRSLKNIIQKSKEDYKAIRKNEIGWPPFVLFQKNVSKVPQFFRKPQNNR